MGTKDTCELVKLALGCDYTDRHDEGSFVGVVRDVMFLQMLRPTRVAPLL